MIVSVILGYMDYKIACIKFSKVDMEQFLSDLEQAALLIEKGEIGKLKI